MAAAGDPERPAVSAWEIPGDRLFDLVPSAVSVVDRDFTIRRVNAAFRRLFGDRVGEACYSVLKGRPQKCASCPMARSFADGQVHQGEELVEAPSGRPLRMAVQTSPFFGPDGEIAGGVEVATDISRSVEQWQELAMLGRAIAGLAHYIKNILTGLDGGVFVVEEALGRNDTQLLQRGWDMVRRNIERVKNLSREQLYCARERPAERRMIAPNAVVCEASRLFAARLTQDDVQLTVELDARAGMGLMDPEGLHNLVTNLLVNAFEACRFDTGKTQHWISVKSVLDASGSYTLEVADNGHGIPSEVNARLFCDVATSTRGASGTGLGLLVVYHVVSAHGGEVSVLSEEGLGSVFTVTLPLQRDAAPSASPEPGQVVEAPAAPATGSERDVSVP